MEAEKGKKEKYSWDQWARPKTKAQIMERATEKNLGLRERSQFQGQGLQV